MSEAWIPAAVALSVVLGVLGMSVLLLQITRRRVALGVSRRFEQLVRDESPLLGSTGSEVQDWVTRMGRWIGERSASPADVAEVSRLLARGGWRGGEAVSLFSGLRNCVAMGMAVIALPVTLGLFHATPRIALFGAFAGGALGYLVPMYALRAYAERRMGRIREDVGLFAEMLCLLFDAGLSLEQALRVLGREGQALFCALRVEIEGVIRQIAAGKERDQALREMADDLAIPELSDLVRMIGQIERYGGAIREPLREFAALLEDRRRTEVQEAVSRLSAKLTLVMVAFLFPALLIFVAGPGLLSLIRSLERAHG
jgi:tight adherence protein C